MFRLSTGGSLRASLHQQDWLRFYALSHTEPPLQQGYRAVQYKCLTRIGAAIRDSCREKLF